MRTKDITHGDITLTYKVPKPRQMFSLMLKSGLDISKLDNEEYLANHNTALLEYMLDNVDPFIVSIKKAEEEIKFEDFEYFPESITFLTDLVSALMAAMGGADAAEKK